MEKKYKGYSTHGTYYKHGTGNRDGKYSKFNGYSERNIFNYLQNDEFIDDLKKIVTSKPEVLMLQNTAGFSVIMQAIVDGNINIIDKIIELFKQYYPNNYQEVLQIELNKYNKANCSTLMAGAKTGNNDIFKKTIEIYEIAYGVKLDENIESLDETKKQNQQKLKNIIATALETLNNDQCNLLMQVVKKGDGEELNDLYELYKKVYPDQYKEKLTNHLKQIEKGGFTVLMEAVINKNHTILKSVIELYKKVYDQEKYKEALQTALAITNNEEFTVLMEAVINKNTEALKSVIELYKEIYKECNDVYKCQQYKETLQQVLQKQNNAFFTVLLEATKDKNLEMLNNVADLHNDVDLPLNFLNSNNMSAIKSIIIDNKIIYEQKIQRLNILIQKGIELNPEEKWKYIKEENNLLFATHCCSLIHKQNKQKLQQLTDRLKNLKIKRYKQKHSKLNNLDKIIENLKVQTQNNYTELLNSFNNLAMELEVNELTYLMKGHISGTEQQYDKHNNKQRLEDYENDRCQRKRIFDRCDDRYEEYYSSKRNINYIFEYNTKSYYYLHKEKDRFCENLNY